MVNPFAETILRLDRIDTRLSELANILNSKPETILDKPPYSSRKRTAILLGISLSMVDKLAASGKLTRRKIGAKTVFNTSEIENLIR